MYQSGYETDLSPQKNPSIRRVFIVAGVGFEPTTFGL